MGSPRTCRVPCPGIRSRGKKSARKGGGALLDATVVIWSGRGGTDLLWVWTTLLFCVLLVFIWRE